MAPLVDVGIHFFALPVARFVYAQSAIETAGKQIGRVEGLQQYFLTENGQFVGATLETSRCAFGR